jgi:hypothetical protein
MKMAFHEGLVKGLARLDDEAGRPMPGERLCKLLILVLGAGTMVWGLLLLLGVGR